MIEYTPMEWALLASALGLVALGLVLGYQAYRGFRRHDSRPMRFLSIGLVLLTAVSYSLAFVGWVVISQGVLGPEWSQPLTLLVRLLQLAGLGCITYSLYLRP